VATLPSTYNPKWHINDARIVNSPSSDNIFTEIDVTERDNYSDTDYVYWITYSAGDYIFNTPTQSGTVVIYYQILPADLSADADKCIVPDAECVAMLAGAKHFLGEDQDEKLKQLYEQEANKKIQAMYTQDLNFGPKIYEYSKISQNSSLTTPGI